MSFPWPYVNPDDVFPPEIPQRCPHLNAEADYLHVSVVLDASKAEVQRVFEQALGVIPRGEPLPNWATLHKCAYHPTTAKAFWVVELKDDLP